MANELDTFLEGEKPDAAAAPEAPPAAEPEIAAEPEAAVEPEEAPAAPPDGRTVPLAALEGERAQRRDWKEKAVRAEGEMAELRRQLEEARKPPPAAAAPTAPAWVNPAENPQGFVERVHSVVLNERLNTSELLLRRDKGAEAVDAAISEFQAAAKADPSLFGKLYAQPDPYGWAFQQVERMRAQREIGDDPAAYKARLRAEWEAEQGGGAPAAPAASGAPRLAPSLATVRSAVPRATAAFNGPPPLSDVFPNR